MKHFQKLFPEALFWKRFSGNRFQKSYPYTISVARFPEIAYRQKSGNGPPKRFQKWLTEINPETSHGMVYENDLRKGFREMVSRNSLRERFLETVSGNAFREWSTETAYKSGLWRWFAGMLCENGLRKRKWFTESRFRNRVYEHDFQEWFTEIRFRKWSTKTVYRNDLWNGFYLPFPDDASGNGLRKRLLEVFTEIVSGSRFRKLFPETPFQKQLPDFFFKKGF